MSDDDKKSLAQQLRAQRAEAAKKAEDEEKAEKAKSMADRMRAAKKEEEAKAEAPQSLADRMRAAKKEAEAEADEPKSLADRMRAAKQQTEEEDKPALKTDPRAALGKAVKQDQPESASTDDAPKKSAAGGVASKLGAAGGAAGAAVTLSDEEADTLDRKIDGLKRDFRRMHERVRLTGLVRDTSNLRTQITGLDSTIEAVRTRGYAFRSYLENKSGVLAEQWSEINDEVQNWIEKESGKLEEELKRVQNLVEQIDAQDRASGARQSLANQLEGLMDTVDSQVKATESHIKALYDAVRREVSVTDKQLKEIDWFMDQKDEASFNFMAGEAVFMVAEAEWDDNKDKPNGMLFLTDQRMIFEQKEKVGKRLGLFGGKDVQSVLWEMPLTAVDGVNIEQRGMFGGRKMIFLKGGSGAPYAEIILELKGSADNKVWNQQINRMISGDAHDERALEPDPELIEKLRNAPTECHVCGGQLPQIMRGQLEVSCRYCSTIIRL